MITTQYEPEQHAGNGSTLAFAVTWPYFTSGDLVVNLRDDATGTDTLQVIGTHYTATTPTSPPGTGTVTFAIAPPSGQTVVIERATPLTQQIDYVESGSFPSESHEQGLDRGLMHDQERKDEQDRTPKFPASDPAASRGDLPSSVDRVSAYAAYDADSKPITVAAEAGAALVTPFSETLLDDADAATARATLGTMKFDADTEANKPEANTFGVGVYYSTDTQLLWYSDGTHWSAITLIQLSQAGITALGATVAGRRYLDTTRYQPFYDDGSNLQPIRHFPTGYINGLGVEWKTLTTFEVQIGGARDSSDVTNLSLAAVLVKTVNTSGAWSAGAAGNAFTVAAPAANSWHRVFIIGKDDGSTDVGCDTSATAANLIAESGYDWYRRVGWVYLDATPDLTPTFYNHSGGNRTYWDVPALAYSDGGDVDYTAGLQRALVFAPPNSVAKVTVSAVNAAGLWTLTDGNQNPGVPSATAAPLGHHNGPEGGDIEVCVNSLRQVYFRTAAGETTVTLYISVLSWYDDRLTP